MSLQLALQFFYVRVVCTSQFPLLPFLSFPFPTGKIFLRASFNSDEVQCIRFSFHGLCFQGQVQTRMFCLALNLTGLPVGTVVNNPPANTGDAGNSGSILGLGRSPGGRNGNPLQYSVQFSLSVMSNSASPWTAACQASLSFTLSWSLLKLMSIK